MLSNSIGDAKNASTTWTWKTCYSFDLQRLLEAKSLVRITKFKWSEIFSWQSETLYRIQFFLFFFFPALHFISFLKSLSSLSQVISKSSMDYFFNPKILSKSVWSKSYNVIHTSLACNSEFMICLKALNMGEKTHFTGLYIF